LHATRLATPCVLYYTKRTATAVNDWKLGWTTDQTKQAKPLSPGRHWLVAMREPWLSRDEATVVYEFFAQQGMQKERKDVSWSTAAVFEVAAGH
jgi:hypothetical protein